MPNCKPKSKVAGFKNDIRRMQRSIITNTWDGYFEYGYEYKFENDLAGERVRFKMVLTEHEFGQFKGNCIEIDGKGMNSGLALIEGFTEGDFISFTKTYPDGATDVYGNPSAKDLLLSYEGNYDWHNHAYSGMWEITSRNLSSMHGEPVLFGSGNWKMMRAF